MREIKFRAKDYQTSKWVYGFIFIGKVDDNRDYAFILQDKGLQVVAARKENAIEFPNDEAHLVDKETIGQYTGLKDKNGKEIYEGDIVLTPFIDPIFGDMVGEELCVQREVLFNDGSFVLKVDNGYVYLECFTRGNNAEVIGNIHDDKGLVEE